MDNQIICKVLFLDGIVQKNKSFTIFVIFKIKSKKINYKIKNRQQIIF